jgi:hypothetical protein
VHRQVILKTADMKFSASDSVVTASQAYARNSCHDSSGWMCDWNQLGDARDPKSSRAGGSKFK